MYSNRGWSYSSGLPRAQNSAYRRRHLHMPRLPRINPLPLALIVVGAAVWYHFGFAGFSLRGNVVDGASGQPVSDAQIWSSRGSGVIGADGSFVLDRVKPPDAVGIEAPGYRAQTLRVLDPFRGISARLDPIGVELDTVDADTNQPVAASLDGPASAITAVGDGRLRIAP